MTPERWQQIHETFHTALAQPSDVRIAFLDQACAGDAELRREVVSMLAMASEAGRFDVLAERFGAAWSADETPERIGAYILLRELGRGGMGTVYLAERTDGGFEQRVALKLLRPGPRRADLYRRFLTERQILARLEHPNIARLLDGGMTEDNQPYFVMEYVDGEPLTTYCNRHRLDVNARLRLFLDVCAAVQYAHRNLVVHRDLKPGNVLVTEPVPEKPGTGQVKLLDFGIAKLLDETMSPAALPLTQTGLRLMTPEYAAPEQVRGKAITTSTDVYQLGVLLYELLTGQRPYRLPGRLLHEVERVICEEDPEKPSTAVTNAENTSLEKPIRQEHISQAREVERLRRRLEGDLDTIVLMAMRKEPERRYVSAEALANDLRRHLDGLPVHARTDTLAYRASKFVRRHRLGVMGIILFIVLTVGFAATMAVQANRTARERDRAEATTAFLLDLFEGFEPVEARGSTVTTRDILDQGVDQIRTELPDQPLLRAKLMEALGQVYRLRGHFPEAEQLLRDALTLRLDHLSPDHLDVAASQHQLGILLSRKNAYEGAEPLLQAALVTYRRALGREHPNVAYVLSELANIARIKGDLDGAEILLREFLDTYRTSPGDLDVYIATSLLFLGKIQIEKGNYDEAEPLLHEALALRRALFGEDHPGVANALDGLGELAHARGDYAEAEQCYRDAYAIRLRLFEEGHTDIASSLAHLGVVLHDQERYAEAEPMLRAALVITRPAYGEQHNIVTDMLYYLGSARAAQGDLEAADSLLSAALVIWRSYWFGIEHPDLARALNSLGLVRIEQGHRQAADSLLQQALAIRRMVLPAHHLDVAESLISLGQLRHAQGNYTAAAPFFRDGLVIQQRAVAEGAWKPARTRSMLGGTLTALQRHAEAEPLLLDGYHTLRDAVGAHHRHTRQALERLINLYEAWGKREQADKYKIIAQLATK